MTKAKTRRAQKPYHVLTRSYSKGKLYGYCSCGDWLGVHEANAEGEATLTEKHVTHHNFHVEKDKREKHQVIKRDKRPSSAKPKAKAK